MPNIIRMMKSRRMRRAWHVAHRWEKRNACKIFWGKSGRKETTKEGIDIGRRIILKWILEK
jgi:hypothetical protein